MLPSLSEDSRMHRKLMDRKNTTNYCQEITTLTGKEALLAKNTLPGDGRPSHGSQWTKGVLSCQQAARQGLWRATHSYHSLSICPKQGLWPATHSSRRWTRSRSCSLNLAATVPLPLRSETAASSGASSATSPCRLVVSSSTRSAGSTTP